MTWVDSLLGGYFWMILGFLTIFFFILTGYVYSAFRTHRLGLSTELAGIITYMLGAIVMLEHYTIAAILSILVLILLSGKETIASWSQHISRQEFSHTLKFGVISLVVLPLLPRESYSINQILGLMGNTFEVSHPILSMPFINPFSIWFFVVIMAGIEYVGYILSKVL